MKVLQQSNNAIKKSHQEFPDCLYRFKIDFTNKALAVTGKSNQPGLLEFL